MMSAIHRSAALHRVSQPITVPAREQPPRSIELRNLTAAIHAIGADIAYEPGALAAKSARRPANRYGLLDQLPFTSGLAEAVVQRDLVLAASNLDLRLGAVPVAPRRGPQAWSR